MVHCERRLAAKMKQAYLQTDRIARDRYKHDAVIVLVPVLRFGRPPDQSRTVLSGAEDFFGDWEDDNWLALAFFHGQKWRGLRCGVVRDNSSAASHWTRQDGH